MSAILYYNLNLELRTFWRKLTPQQNFCLVRKKINGKIFLKIREDIPTKPIEVNSESPCIAQEEPVFFATTDQQETAEKELWKRLE